MSQPHHYNPDPHAHPGLHIIALVEAVKGALALLAASGLEIIGPAPLQRWVHELIVRFQLDPHHGAIAWLLGAISPGGVHLAALGHPILGDELYAGAAAERAPRLLLHASEIAFAHPQNDRRVHFHCPAPFFPLAAPALTL